MLQYGLDAVEKRGKSAEIDRCRAGAHDLFGEDVLTVLRLGAEVIFGIEAFAIKRRGKKGGVEQVLNAGLLVLAWLRCLDEIKIVGEVVEGIGRIDGDRRDFILFFYDGKEFRRSVVIVDNNDDGVSERAVGVAPQCVRILDHEVAEIAGAAVDLQDLMGEAVIIEERHGQPELLAHKIAEQRMRSAEGANGISQIYVVGLAFADDERSV